MEKTFQFSKDLLDYPSNDFKNHLIKDDNNRIIFSGKFGTGKSFFLDHFFKPEVQLINLSDIKYKAFHIYPVNYSIAANEDVFTYIKYDIITSMLLQGIQVEEGDFTYLDALPAYVLRDPMKILALLVYMIPKIGKDIIDWGEKIKDLKEKLLTYIKEKTQAEGDQLVNFLDEIEGKEGSVFEKNIITRLIRNILERLKNSSNQENVLIIDDLDRIDPEHIFRLLNVFAAHLDNPKESPNKLGFDKIILVCDIHNIRNIFKTRYGGQTDFNGYIDKFYSQEVYQFNNRKILLQISQDVFKHVSLRNTSEADSYKKKLTRRDSLPIELLSILINNGYINLRSLLNKLSNQVVVDVNAQIEFDYHKQVRYWDVPLLAQFRILKEVVGGYDILLDLINQLPKRFFEFRYVNLYANQLLFFVNYKKTIFTTGKASIDFEGRTLYMDVKPDITDSLAQLLVYDSRNAKDVFIQYDYTTREFLLLLVDFIDLLKRVDS